LGRVKVDAVAAHHNHTLALAEDGSMYAWGDSYQAKMGAFRLSPSVSDAGVCVFTPQRIPELRVACGL
jgi:alpha-tubulin suppressor-like RCC1 family protein